MKVVAFLAPFAWLSLFFWVGAYEIGIVAGLISVIGICGVFLISLRFNLKSTWILPAFAAIVSPIAVVGVVSAWESVFPPQPCFGDDCPQVIVQLAPDQ